MTLLPNGSVIVSFVVLLLALHLSAFCCVVLVALVADMTVCCLDCGLVSLQLQWRYCGGCVVYSGAEGVQVAGRTGDVNDKCLPETSSQSRTWDC